MALGLVVYDLLFLLVATATYAGAARAGAFVFMQLSTWLPWPLALVPALVAGVLVLIAEVGVLTFLCPRLVPGRYPMMKGKMFWAWLVRSMLRRLLMAPGIKWLVFVSNGLRYLALRAMGARVAFDSSMSSDVDVLDPALLEVGAGATLGARCLTSGHYIDRGQLVLGRVCVEEGALLGAGVTVGPGTVIGRRAAVKALATLGPGCVIGDEAQIGAEALIDAGAKIGARADLGHRVHVAPHVSVPADAKVAAGTLLQ